MLQVAEKWRATYRDNWPDPLADLALPAEVISLSEADLMWLGSAHPGFCRTFDLGGRDPDPPAFGEALADAIEDTLPDGAFIGLSSVSFKRPGVTLMPVFNMDHALDLIHSPHERVAAFLGDALFEKYPLSLVVTPWAEIEKWQEFRLFIRDHTLVGVSQYWWDETFPEIAENEAAISYRLQEFLERLGPALHMETAIVDVRITGTSGKIGAGVLIELNPFIQRADACLFSWKNRGDFDGSFRFNR